MMQKILAGVLMLLSVAESTAQDKKAETIIDFRHRFIQAEHHDDFGEHVDSFRKLHLMVAGNVYQTEQHLSYAFDKQKATYDFKNELRYIQPILSLGDITIANLKTSFGNDVRNMFSSPDEFALALKYAGINTLMHANMLTANIDKVTLSRTRELLYSFDMFHTGAFTDNMQRNGNNPLMINKKGFRIAILNYTKLTLRPSISKDFIINEAGRIYIENDMRMAKANKPDFIIVYFDWGANSQTIPSATQIDLAKYAFEQGADLIVGTDPNTPMRVDYLSKGSYGETREGIVAYSLGNLVASNNEVKNRNGYVIDMEIKKNSFTGHTQISDWGVIPVYTYYDTTSNVGAARVYSVPCAAIESGDIFANIPYIEKRRVVNSAYEVRKLLGSTADEIQYNLNEMVVNNVQESVQLTQASLNNKFSLKREAEIAPTAAPVLPPTAPGSNKAASLAMLYTDTVATPKPAPKNVKPPSTPYEAIKQMTEMVFIEDVPAVKDTVARKEESAISLAPNTGVEIASGTKTADNISLTRVEAPPMGIKTDTIYRIQFYALNKLIPLDTNYYTHLKGYEVYQEDGYYKYLLGRYKSFEECFRFWKTQIQPRYKQSFIVKYIHGKRYLK
jgi:hypothetical protein